ncbi:response regulator [Patescibacteria group bacterium]|nr:response regulator [Patescibacteria group bacterium]
MKKKKQAKKILIIEDETLLAEMYEETFSLSGFDASIASTEEEGIALAKKKKPDFILLDILLQDGNGLHFLQIKSKDPDIAAIPVIAFSNFDDPSTKETAYQLGVLEYIIKANYTPQQIIEKVNMYLK